jgi:hypothetical protein
MTISRQIARIVGPAMIALGISELLNIGIFANVTAPVVYLNGTLLLVAGLAVVQAHNLWTPRWPILITLTGWMLLLGGLYRMFFPDAPQMSPGLATNAFFVAIAAIGALLSYKAYSPERKP